MMGIHNSVESIKQSGCLYWITGLSGSGKTTIANALWDEMKAQGEAAILLDGDTMREVLAAKNSYSREERFCLAQKYARLCQLLTLQGHTVICATVSMFESIRQWNREHNIDYFEIYLEVAESTLIERDQKGLYSNTSVETNTQPVALANGFEAPQNPDLIINNAGKASPTAIAHDILKRSRCLKSRIT